MKFMHLSDLHLGKHLHEFSLLEDQRYILSEILQMVDREKPDGILLAGDIYDKSVPSTEAVALLDDFLFQLSQRGFPVFIISGNHDSPERLSFGSRLMKHSGIYLAPVYSGTVSPLTLEDTFGPVRIYLLPFLKPAHVRKAFPDKEINSYTDALRTAIDSMEINPGIRNLLITHQFVTGAKCGGSEEISVGGSDNVDASVFEPFDYVALGHIHNPQSVGRDTIRYSGSPLKYSFSEARRQKSVTIVEMREKGNISIRLLPLFPLRELIELRGSYEELTFRGFYEGTTYPKDYVRITLTDEEDIPDVIRKLRTIYHNLMELSYDNKRTRAGALSDPEEDIQQKSPLELFDEFYAAQNGQPMSQQQREYTQALMERIWEGEI